MSDTHYLPGAGPFGLNDAPDDVAASVNRRATREVPKTRSTVALRSVTDAERARTPEENDALYAAALADKQRRRRQITWDIEGFPHQVT